MFKKIRTDFKEKKGRIERRKVDRSLEKDGETQREEWVEFKEKAFIRLEIAQVELKEKD